MIRGMIRGYDSRKSNFLPLLKTARIKKRQAHIYICVCVYLYDRGQTDKNTGQNGDELQYQLKMNLPGFGTAQMMNHTQMMTGIFVRASV